MLKRIVGTIAALWISSAVAQASDHKSSIVVLVDVSATWHNRDSADRNVRLLKKVNQGLGRLTKELVRPTSVTYLAIRERSLEQEPICQASYRPALIGNSKRTAIQRSSELDSFLEGCAHAALAMPVSPWTDISGALELMRRQTDDTSPSIDRYAVILSDMKEERPTPFIGNLDLKGYRVLIAYRVLPEDDKDPAAFKQRIDDWKRRLQRAGAVVSTVSDVGLVPDAIAHMSPR